MQVEYEELDIIIIIHAFTRRTLGRAHVPPTKVFRQLAVNTRSSAVAEKPRDASL